MTEQEHIEELKKNGRLIKHIQNPTEKMQWAAVKQDSTNIRFIESPTESVQMLAVCIRPINLIRIKNPTDFVFQEAIRRDPSLIHYFPSDKIPLMARLLL